MGLGSGRAGWTSKVKGRRVNLDSSVLSGSVLGRTWGRALGLVPCVGSSEQGCSKSCYLEGPLSRVASSPKAQSWAEGRAGHTLVKAIALT